MRTVEAGTPGAPLVVLAHGFPDLAHTWRHQIGPLAGAGFHVLAPDQRGYGGSGRPADVTAYDIHHLTADLLALLDWAGAQRAVVVGHDWGAMVAWHTALLHPDRVRAVAGISVPPVPRPRSRPTERWREKFGDDFYMLRFQEPGPAEAMLGADVAATMRGLFAGAPDADLPPWLDTAAFEVYVREFTRTGFTGGLNWYRNYDRNWETTGALDSARITVPALFVGGTADPVLGFMRPERATEVVVEPYRQVLLDGAGHWVHQERADEVTAILLDFLGEVR
ncbi:epoxide hydrolase A [Mycolicibacterium murale]|uniref:Epoxide hydrolase A n=1 Tax=Mycolicibacterium murale TaxID=182220 RepID=A0A7I9WXE8_9MYCO|nr:epoxide hydrolase A [Mycolicibacterium murale]